MRIAVLSFVVAAFALSGCGNPDNLVLGGFNGAIITEVHSAIHGNGKVQTSATGAPTDMSIIILSDSNGLCDKLQQHPDFFRTSYEVSTALIMFVPQEKIGTFFPGSDNAAAEMIVGQSPPGTATPKLPAAYPAASFVGGMTGSEFDSSPGGESKGNFDLVLVDQAQGGHEFTGHFQTGACPALSQVVLP
ncbi:MAG: hypothetical protein ACJ78U_18710 [Myxococcales bacterium]